jgi:hypothetical protein
MITDHIVDARRIKFPTALIDAIFDKGVALHPSIGNPFAQSSNGSRGNIHSLWFSHVLSPP